jgi:hypothetical protein
MFVASFGFGGGVVEREFLPELIVDDFLAGFSFR